MKKLAQPPCTRAEEPEQSSDIELPALTSDEQLLYHRLKQHHWGVNVRLEQERIPWAYAWELIQGCK